MTSGDATAWQLTANALDHHATVKALAEAMPGWLQEADATANEAAADTMATALARQGLALVEIAQDQSTPAWFERGDDR